MKIFVSWSDNAAHEMARVLKSWLPEVIQELSLWLSSEDIGKGQRWSAEVARILTEINDGIICVTRENVHRPWLNFEAGALAKNLETGRVRTVLLVRQPPFVT
jgi:hypothetical protein